MDIFLVSSNSVVMSYGLLKRFSGAVLHATFAPHVVQKSLKTFSIYQCPKAAFAMYLNIIQKFTFNADNSKQDSSLICTKCLLS